MHIIPPALRRGELFVVPLVWRNRVYLYAYKELCKLFLCRLRRVFSTHRSGFYNIFQFECFHFVNSPN